MQCSHCSANIAAEDLPAGVCPYCKTVLPHVAKAHEKAAMVKEMFADRDGDGMPDVFGAARAGSMPQNSTVTTTVSNNGSHQTVTTSHTSTSHTSNVVVHRTGGPLPAEAQRALQRAGVQIPGVTAAAHPRPPQVFLETMKDLPTQTRRTRSLASGVIMLASLTLIATIIAVLIFVI